MVRFDKLKKGQNVYGNYFIFIRITVLYIHTIYNINKYIYS